MPPKSAGKKQGRVPPPEYTFKKGESGNPAGRPKGSRNKLGEAFIEDVYAKWKEAGTQALTEMLADDPGGFVRVVAGILPKEMVIKDELSDVSDDELAALVIAARKALGDRDGRGSKASSADSKKQAKDIPSVH